MSELDIYVAGNHEARREFLMPGCSVIDCLVEGCEFSLILPPQGANNVADNPLALAAAMGLEVASATLARQQAEHVDELLRGHLEEHSVLDWVLTIKTLEEANAAWENECERIQGEAMRALEMTEIMRTKLEQAESALGQRVDATPARARTSPPPRDAMPLPAGIPMPVLDPMKEPIVPTDRREQGQVARKG